MRSRRGVELAINMFVMITLALIMLGLGLYLFFTLFESVPEMVNVVDENTEQQLIEQMISSGEQVKALEVSKTIERGELGIFYIGVKNTIPSPASHKFILMVTFEGFLDTRDIVKSTDTFGSGAAIDVGEYLNFRYFLKSKNIESYLGTAQINPVKWIIGDTSIESYPVINGPGSPKQSHYRSIMSIKYGQYEIFPVGIKPMKKYPPGTYVFSVATCIFNDIAGMISPPRCVVPFEWFDATPPYDFNRDPVTSFRHYISDSNPNSVNVPLSYPPGIQLYLNLE